MKEIIAKKKKNEIIQNNSKSVIVVLANNKIIKVFNNYIKNSNKINNYKIIKNT